jgi:hypothetical protein
MLLEPGSKKPTQFGTKIIQKKGGRRLEETSTEHCDPKRSPGIEWRAPRRQWTGAGGDWGMRGCGATVIGRSRSSCRSRGGGNWGRSGWWDRNSEVSIGRKGWGDGQKGKRRNSSARCASGTGKEKRSQTVKVAAEKWAHLGTCRVVVGGGTERRNGS